MNLEMLNTAEDSAARKILQACCGSSCWVEGMLIRRPFGSTEEVFSAAESIWRALSEADWLEAFAHHPKIGDIDALKTKFASTSHLASEEQAGASNASSKVLTELREQNIAYEKKNRFIFIVCATGKSAKEMLGILQQRLANDRTSELQTAANEQAKITRLRLEKIQ